MALETGDYISDLVITNPVGATDPKSQGDDHIRLLKKTVKQTFPNLSGAMTLTHGNLNALAPFFTDPNADRIAFWDDSAGAFAFLAPDGTTIAISGTSLAVGSNVPKLDTANTFTATPNRFGAEVRLNAAAPFLSFYNAANSTRFGYMQHSGTNFSILNEASGGALGLATTGGGAITFNGVNVTDFARLSQSNTFTGATQTFSNAAAQLALTGSTVTGKVQTDDGGTNFYVGTTSAHRMSLISGNSVRLEVGSTGNFDFKGGAVTTSNASASEVGKTGAPSRTISSSTNTAASDQGRTVRMTGGSGQTFTLDSDVPADCVVVLDNASGNSWTIAASGTLTWATTGGTGSRTLANGGLAVALSLGSGNYKITGGGLS